MAIKSNLTIKLDQDVRNEFSRLCDDIGISMAGALNALIKQSIRDKSLSFSLKDENGFTPTESAALLQRIEAVRLEKNKLVTHALIEVDECIP